MNILIKSLLKEIMAIGSIIRAILLILLGLIICTCSGPKLMLGNQSLEKQIDYSLFSGKLAKQIQDVTECATSKIDGVAFHSWHREKQLILQQSVLTQGMVYFQNQELTQKNVYRQSCPNIS